MPQDGERFYVNRSQNLQLTQGPIMRAKETHRNDTSQVEKQFLRKLLLYALGLCPYSSIHMPAMETTITPFNTHLNIEHVIYLTFHYDTSSSGEKIEHVINLTFH